MISLLCIIIFFALAYEIVGPTPFAARLFPALMGWSTLCLVFFEVRRNFGRVAALVSGMTLLASIHWLVQFHLAVPDPFLIFFITLSLILFVHYWEGNCLQKSYLRWLGVTLGLAVLSKGPVALGLVGITVTFFLLFQEKGFWRKLKLVLDPWTILIFLLIASPWYILISWKTDGVWVQEFFFKHNLSRFSAPMEGHGGAFYLTLVFVLLGMMPGSFIILACWRSLTGYTKLPAILKVSILFTAVTIIFFMISGTKLIHYTAPVYPFMSILVGWLLGGGKIGRTVKWSGLLGLLILLAFPFGIFVGLNANKEYDDQAYLAWYFFAAYGAGLFSLVFWIQQKWILHWISLCIGFVIISLTFFTWVHPVLDQKNPVLASNVSHYSAQDFYFYKSYNPAFSFMLQKPIIDIMQVNSREIKGGIVILRKKDLEEFEKLEIDYEKVFEGSYLFEPPIAVLLRIKQSE